jgi:hypothetical protein
MVSTKKAFNLIIASVICGFSLTACGNNDPYANAVPMVYYDNMYSTNTNQQAQNTNQCCCTCQNTITDGTQQNTQVQNNTNVVTTPVTTTPTTTTPAITPTKPANTATIETKPATTPAPAVTTPVSTASKGRQALDKVMEKISTAAAFQADIDKYERNLKDGSAIQQGITIYGRKPGSVKLEITSHSTKPNNVGAKVTYVIGTGKATVRPGGALSFITKEMDQTDSNITSPNEYTPEQVDFFSMTKRLSSQDYKAELSGKTTMNGADVYLITITKSGTNDFDARVTKETIGFDPKTFDVKLWEAYTDASPEAFFRVNIKSFKALSTLPDSTFKV